MSENAARQAGHCEIKRFLLRDFELKREVDLRAIVYSLTISESIDTGSVRGTAVVLDTADVIRNFPLRGEEYLQIDYEDFFGTERSDEFMIYSITDHKYSNDSAQASIEYKLHFASIPKMISESARVRRAFRDDTVSEFAKQIYDMYFNPPVGRIKEFEVEPTLDVQAYTIPNMSPEHAMHFLSRRAYGTSEFQSYRFFENRDKYFFCTDEHLRRLALNGVGYGEGYVDPRLADAAGITPTTIPVFTMNYAPGHDPRRQYHRMFELVSVDFGSVTNSVEDIHGGYMRRVTEIDMLTGLVTSHDYDFPSRTLHSPLYRDTQMRRVERFTIKDYPPPDTAVPGVAYRNRYPELYTRKPLNAYHRERQSISVTIYGHNRIVAGGLITLLLFEHTAGTDPKIDEYRSDEYLIEAIDNRIVGNVYKQDLRLSRAVTT